MDIPTSAKVECVDGAGGRCTGVIIGNTTWRVTHFVDREDCLSRTRSAWSRADWVTR